MGISSGVPAVEGDICLTCSGAERGLSPFMQSSSPSDCSIVSLMNREVFLGGLEKRCRNVLLALLVDLLTRLAMIEQGTRVMLYFLRCVEVAWVWSTQNRTSY